MDQCIKKRSFSQQVITCDHTNHLRQQFFIFLNFFLGGGGVEGLGPIGGILSSGYNCRAYDARIY